MIVGIIGLGLIGGSIAKDLRSKNIASTIIGFDTEIIHAQQALIFGLIDELETVAILCEKADVVIVAIPVDATAGILPHVLSKIKPDAVVIDVGSTKQAVIEAITHVDNRDRFVATHPIAGTENNGPEAAINNLFDGKVSIICNASESAADALNTVERLYETLGMRLVYMDAAEHDLHLAYVSHLSHVSSFMLGLTVLDMEKNEQNIFDLAGSGFASTVRLAKSSPAMWAPIFKQNTPAILMALDSYINYLQHFRYQMASGNKTDMEAMMTRANDIRRVLNKNAAVAV